MTRRSWISLAINLYKAYRYTDESARKKNASVKCQIQMSKELNNVINKTKDQLELEVKDEQLAIKAPLAAPALVTPPKTKQNVEAAIVPFEPDWNDEPDFDLMQIVSELEEGKLAELQPKLTTNNTNSIISQNLVQQHNSPMFAGCRIGNITININKT